jgi:hypothetical protein
METRTPKTVLNSGEKSLHPAWLNHLLVYYRNVTANAEDPIEAEVARRQLAALERLLRRKAVSENEDVSRDTSRNTLSKSKWSHVPLVDIFRLAGNRVYPRSDGTFDCGHEPCHGSKSGRCVTVNVATGRWFCRSCRQGGDAVAAVRSLFGLDYGGAIKWLTERFGPPKTNYPLSKISYPKRPIIIKEICDEVRA